MKTNSKAVEFIYQDTQIHFLLGKEKNVMVNATEMAKAFGKKTEVFLKADHVKSFIEVIKLPPFGGSLGINSHEDLIDFRGRNGIYFHRILALKFASWLDASFEIWIYSTIEEILFGNAKKVGEKITDAEQKKKDIAKLIQDVRNSGDENAIALLDNLEELKVIEKDKKKAMAIFSNQFKMDFN